MAYNVLLTSLALPTFELEISGVYGLSEDSYVIASAVVPQPRNTYPVLGVAVNDAVALPDDAPGASVTLSSTDAEAVPPPPVPIFAVAEKKN